MKMKLVSFVVICTLLLVPTIAFAEVTDGNIVNGFTPMRLRALVAVVAGLISVVIGGVSMSRFAGRFGTGKRRVGSIVAVVVGLIGIVIATLHLANSTGGWGTGNGRAGATFAIVLGLTGMVLARITLARSRRAG
ncbi:DUF6223 family protein [Paenibacillus sp. V4I5]|uniref:DUF6223 family protein n=1 Tax=Paenibacillus sp. V4I5 TaxID=3042306 RepID=UPI0027908C31|nr:DUF6223 family protein [Paenibacillus sp. V4I5]MDQ0917093.1 putative membrane protein [Paenibacillus sp. V4I5]